MKTILCCGDWGHDPTESVQNFFQEYIYDELFLLGDNFYPSGVETIYDKKWRERVFSLFPEKIIKRACLGNHDYLGNPLSQIEYTFFGRPRQKWYLPHYYYDVVDNQESIHCFFLDTQILATDITYELLDACFVSDKRRKQYTHLVHQERQRQINWLRRTLGKSTSRWKIVCGHYPILSNGPHHVSPMMKEILYPILKEFKVDLYLSGHDHNTQCIKDGTIVSIVSAGVFPEGYHIERINEPTTIFMNNDPGLISIKILENRIYLYNVTIETKKETLIHIMIKD